MSFGSQHRRTFYFYPTRKKMFEETSLVGNRLLMKRVLISFKYDNFKQYRLLKISISSFYSFNFFFDPLLFSLSISSLENIILSFIFFISYLLKIQFLLDDFNYSFHILFFKSL